MSVLIVALIVVASFITAFMSSMFGMLGGMTLFAVLANVMPIGAAMVLHGILQLTANVYRAWLNRRDIQWAIIGYFAIGGLIGLAILKIIDFSPNRIVVLFGLGIMPYIIVAIPKAWALDATKKPVAFVAGWLVVLINLLTGVSGPVLDLFFQKTALTRHQVVATKAVLSGIGHSAKIIFFGALVSTASLANWPALELLILAMIASMLGTRVGKYALDNMQDATFFSWTQRILLTMGALLIARAIQLMLERG